MTSKSGTTPCINCGADAGPSFCPECGQELRSRRGPLLEVAADLLSEWLSLDGQLVRPLRALVHPGRSSELYAEGKRAPYLRPVRLYFVASLALFSTVLTLESPDATGITVYLGGERVGAEASGPVRRELDLLKGDGLIGAVLRRAAGDRIERARALPKQQVVDMFLAGFRGMLPAGLILFVPFLALGLKLLYIRGTATRTLYLDHLVFAIHYQSALFFALSLTWLLAWLAEGGFVAAAIGYVVVALFTMLVYLPMALRRFYRQSRTWTAAKAFVLLWIYAQLLGLVINFSGLYGIWDI